jgi:hypothetical protein
MIKVKLTHTLVGKTNNTKSELPTNSDRLNLVLSFIDEQFGDRPVHILDGNLVMGEENKYPSHFAAGWFIGDGLKDGSKVSELVVVGHGNSLKVAREYLMNSMKNVNWQELAKDVK